MNLLEVGPKFTRPTCRAVAAVIGRCLLPAPELSSKPAPAAAAAADRRDRQTDGTLTEADFAVYDACRILRCSVLFYSLAVLDPRVGHTMDVLSPFIPVLCHSDCLFHRESCPRLDVVHPGRAWPSSLACTWHCSLHYLFLQATPLFPHGVTVHASFLVLTVSNSSLFTPADREIIMMMMMMMIMLIFFHRE